MKLPATNLCEVPLLSSYNSFPNSQAVSQDLQLKLPIHLGDGARSAVVRRRRIERKSNVAKRNGVVPVSCQPHACPRRPSVRGGCLSCLGYRAACMNNRPRSSSHVRARILPLSTKVPPFVTILQGPTDATALKGSGASASTYNFVQIGMRLSK